MMRLVSQVMVAPLLVGGPNRYVITCAYGVAGLFAGVLWLLMPVALWRSFGMATTFLWLIPTTLAIFAITAQRESRDEVPDSFVEVPEDVDADEDLPHGYHDWLAEIMQPPPRWYRICQWTAIGAFSLLIGAAVLEQWFLWMYVLVDLTDPWAIIVGVTIATLQMLRLFNEIPKPRQTFEG